MVATGISKPDSETKTSTGCYFRCISQTRENILSHFFFFFFVCVFQKKQLSSFE